MNFGDTFAREAALKMGAQGLLSGSTGTGTCLSTSGDIATKCMTASQNIR